MDFNKCSQHWHSKLSTTKKFFQLLMQISRPFVLKNLFSAHSEEPDLKNWRKTDVSRFNVTFSEFLSWMKNGLKTEKRNSCPGRKGRFLSKWKCNKERKWEFSWIVIYRVANCHRRGSSVCRVSLKKVSGRCNFTDGGLNPSRAVVGKSWNLAAPSVKIERFENCKEREKRLD